MTPYYETKLGKLYHGDCREALKSFPDNHYAAVITDPPYELGFMGKKWDSSGVAFQVETWIEILRVSKPGAMLLAFGGTRTHHRLMCAIEDAEWEIRDCLMWLYGSGFPKSLDISKAIDKAAGAEREVVGPRVFADGTVAHKTPGTMNSGWERPWMGEDDRPALMESTPNTKAAQTWNGFGTALKPAYEPIILAMKPVDDTFTNNALVHGVAGLNIDAGRIGTEVRKYKGSGAQPHKLNAHERGDTGIGYMDGSGKDVEYQAKGRWPANIILDEEAGKMLDEQSSVKKEGKTYSYVDKTYDVKGFIPSNKPASPSNRGDAGGASRFFYCAKASKKERGEGNTHPTVKPIALIEYLINLVSPPTDSIILDPFCGSGTTPAACERLNTRWEAIEKIEEYCEISAKRINQETSQLKLW